jgi:hypothetical protein
MQGWVILIAPFLEGEIPAEVLAESMLSVPVIAEELSQGVEQVQQAYPDHQIIGMLARRQMLGLVQQIDELAAEHQLRLDP